MNKEEAVLKLIKVASISEDYAKDLYDSIVPKPVVPQYVADWYEENKDDFDKNVFEIIYFVVSFYTMDNEDDFEDFESLFEEWRRDDFKRWMSQAYKNGAITTLVNMNQFGYEVEGEKEYVIELKNSPQILLYDEKIGEYYFSVHQAIFSRNSHTRKELEESGFGWVFDCEGIEAKEVE